MVVYSRSEDSVIGTIEYQLTAINRTDPPAELFKVPADYAVTPTKFPLTWENPYKPRTSLNGHGRSVDR